MKMNSTKSKLMASLLVLVLCVTAFFGSTYAWFTDSVTSSGNIIKAGDLDATLKYYDDDESDWKNASEGAIFDYDKWEPGYTAIRKVKIGNAGDLAFQFMLNIIPSAIPETDAPDLADVIDVYIFTDGSTVTRETVKGATSKGTLAQLMADGDGAAHGVLYPSTATEKDPHGEIEVTIALKMQESAGNEYMNASVGGGFKVQLLATQLAYEGDSFGPDYDIDADYTPDYGIFKEVTATATAAADVPTVISDESGVKATVPANAVAAGTELKLKVTPSPDTVPDGFLVTEDQAILNYEIKMENLPSDNTKPITVELPLAKGLENVELYHNGVKIASAYNAETGILSFTTTSFSPFTVVYGKNTIDAEEKLPEDPTEENTILIGTAEELAGLAKAVNEGNTFEGKTVKLTNDINLRNAEWTPIGRIGTTSTDFTYSFKGTFDGQNHTVKNFSVSNEGWAGLFGVVYKGDIKNVKVENVTLNSNRMTGAIVGQLYGNLENCHVTNATITVVPNAVSNGYDNGDKVGGVVGWLGDNGNNHELKNCSATNVNIKAYRDMGGIAGYVAWSTTISDNKVNNITLTVDQVTNSYGKKDSNAKAIWGRNSVSKTGVEVNAIDNEESNVTIKEIVATADGMVAALEDKQNVLLSNDIKIDPANMSNAYGTTGINVKYGQTIDGAGHTLDIKGAGGTWDSGINTTGGLIKDLTVTGSFRGIFINHNSDYSEKVVLDNVTIEGTTYTISCDQGLNQNFEATKSTFKGWTSYAATLGNAKFVDCYFGEGNGYSYCRPYAPTEFVGCDFEAGFVMDPRAAVTFENCTLDGVALTADNLATLVTNIANATVK